jgi:hypothetical protein
MGVLLALRGGKAMLDVSIFGFVSLSITLAFFLPVREQVVSFFGYRLVNSPAIGVTLPMYAVDLVRLSAVPMLLALVGWWVARRRRGLATVLLLAMLMWPAYHLVLRDSVSRSKHLVFGFLFGYPLVGLALDWGWECAGRQFGAHPRLGKALGRGSVAVLVLGLAALGAVQLGRFNQAWPDARPAAEYLLAHVRPGHKLLINESWPYTTYLYAAGRIDSPWDVFDVYRITHGQSEIDLCDYDWFVDSQGAYQWPGPIVFRIHRCGGFERVFVSESTVVGMGPELDYVRYPVKVAVWRNVASALETEGGAK